MQEVTFMYNDNSSGDLLKNFQAAVDYVKANKSKLPSKALIELEACFKQVQFGDTNTPMPSAFNPKARQSWKAWKELSGVSLEEAMQMYIDLLKSYDKNWPPKL